MQILENKKIRLRALEPTDLKTLHEWENNSDLWELSNTLAPYSLYILKQYIQNSASDIYQNKQLRLVIELKENNKAIGLIDLFDFDPYNKRAGVGILIYSKLDRKKDYANQALETLCRYSFDVLDLHQLYCNIDIDNFASIKLFEKNNFKIIGQKKQWLKRSDHWIDEIMLQKIKS